MRTLVRTYTSDIRDANSFDRKLNTFNVQIQRDPPNDSSDHRNNSSDHRNQTRYNIDSMKKQAAIIVIYSHDRKKGAKYW